MSVYFKNGIKDEKIVKRIDEKTNSIYKKKYSRLKKLVKRYVYVSYSLLIIVSYTGKHKLLS